MTKIATSYLVSMSLALFVIMESRTREKAKLRRLWLGLAVHVGLGSAIAAPWYAFMTMAHGIYYWRQAMSYHVLARIARPLEGHYDPLGYL
jgi:4-amino-4-deoxy-L-arabinose transferase-like glycosyltransferase